MNDSGITLVVRKTIAAPPERLFDAWTKPDQLRRWWGPQGVECVDPEIDLRVGGGYRIGNRMPDGAVLWIAGEFEAVERPNRLVFTWRLEGDQGFPERVTVSFAGRGDTTDVTVTHERIANGPLRDRHREGWEGCLDGLERYVRVSAV